MTFGLKALGIGKGLVPLIAFVVFAGCVEVRRVLTEMFSGTYGPPDEVPELKAEFTGADELRERIPITLTTVARGFHQPTDILFEPGRPDVMIVLEQGGAVKWYELTSGKRGVATRFDVATVSEQGLLGMVFHPAYPDSPLFYVNLTPSVGTLSRVLEVRLNRPASITTSSIESMRTVMEVEQPYQNHNAGQLAFGPDGYLYIGWGDGGWIGDPHNNSQTTTTLLGKMLRIDPRPTSNAPYSIPDDNPFVGSSSTRPEIWATGLRNPWRYCFDRRGRLVVPDVGQNAWKEINIVERGKNYGWRCREGFAPYDESENCRGPFADPFYVYGRDEGQSITGGYEYLAEDIPKLTGLYVFGDFISGRIWALRLPQQPSTRVGPRDVLALGRWPVQISTFGRDEKGKLYLADYGLGIVYRIDPARAMTETDDRRLTTIPVPDER